MCPSSSPSSAGPLQNHGLPAAFPHIHTWLYPPNTDIHAWLYPPCTDNHTDIRTLCPSSSSSFANTRVTTGTTEYFRSASRSTDSVYVMDGYGSAPACTCASPPPSHDCVSVIETSYECGGVGCVEARKRARALTSQEGVDAVQELLHAWRSVVAYKEWCEGASQACRVTLRWGFFINKLTRLHCTTRRTAQPAAPHKLTHD
eukprot:178173-Chlamydomonas_euryale.AAC.1